jgi:hypothetical protein
VGPSLPEPASHNSGSPIVIKVNISTEEHLAGTVESTKEKLFLGRCANIIPINQDVIPQIETVTVDVNGCS